jgi:hypothetical protein
MARGGKNAVESKLGSNPSHIGVTFTTCWFGLLHEPPAFRGPHREPFSESWMRETRLNAAFYVAQINP